MSRRLCVDPGETVGWSLWTDDGKLLGGSQTPLWSFAADVWDGINDNSGPLAEGEEDLLRGGVTKDDNTGKITQFVVEKFALYPWEAKNLAWDEFRTSQLIGALTFMAQVKNIGLHKQPASIKERAISGGAKELFVRPLNENRHTNDSIMHGWYYYQTQIRKVNVPEVRDGSVEKL
jgi:hypothetical protein